MATVFVNATAIGSPRSTGTRVQVSRGTVAAGDISIKFDTAKFPSQGAVRAAVMDMLSTLGDTVK